MTYILDLLSELFLCRHLKSEAIHRSPRQLNMENRIRRLENSKLISNGNITNKTPFLDGYGDKNLISHVIKSNKAWKGTNDNKRRSKTKSHLNDLKCSNQKIVCS